MANKEECNNTTECLILSLLQAGINEMSRKLYAPRLYQSQAHAHTYIKMIFSWSRKHRHY